MLPKNSLQILVALFLGPVTAMAGTQAFKLAAATKFNAKDALRAEMQRSSEERSLDECKVGRDRLLEQLAPFRSKQVGFHVECELTDKPGFPTYRLVSEIRLIGDQNEYTTGGIQLLSKSAVSDCWDEKGLRKALQPLSDLVSRSRQLKMTTDCEEYGAVDGAPGFRVRAVLERVLRKPVTAGLYR